MKRLDDKQPSNFRLSKKARSLLCALAKEEGIGMTAVMENMIRKYAKEHNINYDDLLVEESE